jgi:hypothetical protein
LGRSQIGKIRAIFESFYLHAPCATPTQQRDQPIEPKGANHPSRHPIQRVVTVFVSQHVRETILDVVQGVAITVETIVAGGVGRAWESVLRKQTPAPAYALVTRSYGVADRPPRRWVVPTNEDYHTDHLPVQWQSWLRHRRPIAPTLEEIERDNQRIQEIQAKAHKQ